MVDSKRVDKTLSTLTCSACGLSLASHNPQCASHKDSFQPLAQESLLGKTIGGRYLIQELLGRGGMGMVYKAMHQLMNRVVAIKILHKHLGGDVINLKRFQQEAQAASHLAHPHIIAVHDFGISEDGQPFLVMDYLKGVSLGDIIERDKFVAPTRALNIFIQACDALQHAHEKGVIHRDLKPSNIMLIQDGKQPDFVKIVDFGIAKLLPQEGEQLQKLTQTGEIFGSPVYMSPEQVMGQKMDARSDVYSMGCVMYEALVGKPPLMGENMLETMYKHLNENPQPMNITRSSKDKYERFEAVVFNALIKDPQQRYQSMAELKEDLQLILEDSPGGRALAKLAERQAAEVKLRLQKRITLALTSITAAGVIAFLCLGAIVWTNHFNGPNASALRSPLFWQDLGIEKPQMPFEQGRATLLESYCKAAAHAIPDSHPKKLVILKRLADIYLNQERYSEAEAIYETIYGIASDNKDPDNQMAAAAQMADFNRAQGFYDKAASWLNAVIEYNRKTFGALYPDNAKHLLDLASCYYHLNQDAKVMPILQESLSIWEKQKLPDDFNLTVLLNNLAVMSCRHNELDYADHCQKMACQLFEDRLNPETDKKSEQNPYYCQDLNNLAYIYYRQGDLQEAKRLYETALDYLTQAKPRQPLAIAKVQNNYAELMWKMQHWWDWLIAKAHAEGYLPN